MKQQSLVKNVLLSILIMVLLVGMIAPKNVYAERVETILPLTISEKQDFTGDTSSPLYSISGSDAAALAWNTNGAHAGMEGNVYSYDACFAGGWALDYDTPTTAREIRVLAKYDNVWHTLGSMTANEYRADAVSLCPGMNGSCGFGFRFAHLIPPNQTVETQVSILSNEGKYVLLRSTPRMIKCVNTGSPPLPVFKSAAVGSGVPTAQANLSINFGYNYDFYNSAWNGAYSGVAGYYTYYGSDPNGTSAAFITTGRSDLTYSYNISAPSAGMYYLRVNLKAVNGNTSGWTTVFTHKYDNLAPNAPAAPAVVTNGSVPNNTWTNKNNPAFSWNAAADNGLAGMQGYYMYWGSDPGGAASIFSAGNAYSPAAITVSSSYYLRARSLDNAGNLSGWQTLFTYKYDGSAPAPVAVPVTETHGIPDYAWTDNAAPAFSWSAPADTGGSGIKGYYIYWGNNAGGTAANFQTNAAYTPAPIGVRGEYYLRLQTQDNAGNLSAWTRVFTYRYDNGAPDVVRQIAESHGIQPGFWTNQSQPSFTWQTPDAFGHAPVSGYNVYWGTNNGAVSGSFQSGTSFSPGTLGSGTASYYLRIQTVNGAGIASPWVTVFTYAFDNVALPVPGAPAVESHGTANNSDVHLNNPAFSWAPPTAGSGAAVAGYNIYWGLDAGGSAGSYQTTANFTPALLTANGSYHLRVQAQDTAGNLSGWNTLFSYHYSKVEVTKYYDLGGVQGMRANNANYTLIGDQVSSTVMVVDASGNVVAQSLYYPFGQERYRSGTMPTDKTYTSQREEDFGLLDYNARYYSAALGSFVSPDTLVPQPSNMLDWNR